MKKKGSASPRPEKRRRPIGRAAKKNSRRASAPLVREPPARAVVEPSAVVGIGASAGGIEALTRLFEGVPIDSGMTFVVIQHLDPSHESMLVEILARTTRLPVTEVASGMKLAPDHVFVIPPNSNMELEKGAFRLTPYSRTRGWHMPIDRFLRSLAEEQGPRAIAVVLSGAASDGALGCRAVKAEGGVTFAQEESTARFPEMPHAVIALGAADFVLPPARIAEELGRISRHPTVRSGPETPDTPDGEAALTRVLSLLRAGMGVDFSNYRKTTIRRRVQRRMILHRVASVEKYAEFIKANPEEVRGLYDDILITVTSFFRDRESFTLLRKKIFPKLLETRSPSEPIRIWVPGCATGEEVYSLAITLLEASAEAQILPPVQMFGTDISEKSIQRARTGVYPSSIAQDVSPERLKQFFVRRGDVYQVAKSIRDLCIFARQDLGADPPFSNLDLISCRNLLIYMEPHLQKRILPLFHYALKASGYLLLGSSETIRNFDVLFEAQDKKHRLFAKRAGAAAYPIDFGDMPRSRIDVARAAFEPRTVGGAGAGGAVDLQRRADRLLLGRFTPPAVIVNAHLEVVQFRGETRAYLGAPSGKATLNVLKLAREGLLLPLKEAIQEAKRAGARVRKSGGRIRRNGTPGPVEVEVTPLGDPGGHLLVLFEDAAPRPGKAGKSARATRSEEGVLVRLEQELSATKEYLQSIIEEQEATNEELTSANEEILSSNEELQSTNEELETAKEELQSTNEELTTVNDELQQRNADLAGANSDLSNVFASVNIPMIILDSKGTIRRFTPLAERLLNVIPGDIGRPLRDLKTNIDVPDLAEIVADVISQVEGREREIQDARGDWYLMRIRPYRTAENRIDGAVIAFLDIDPVKLGLEQVNRARDYAEALVETISEALLVLDGSLRVRTANQPFYRTFDTSPLRVEGKELSELPGWRDPGLRAFLDRVVRRRETVSDVEWQYSPGGGEIARTLLLNAGPIRLPTESQPLVLLAIQDITVRKGAEAALRESEARYRKLFEMAREGILLIEGGSGRIVDANPFLLDLLGRPRDRVVGESAATFAPFLHPRAPAGAWAFEPGSRLLQETDIPLLKADGSEIRVRRSCAEYEGNSGRLIQCSLRLLAHEKGR